MGVKETAERLSFKDPHNNYVFQRSILAYVKASEYVKGDILEIGCGEGYGVEVLSPLVNSYLTIDKFQTQLDFSKFGNVRFKQMNIPPLEGLQDNSFDYVVSFQVIEHIKDDHQYLKEIVRVLKPGGRFICTTPNKKMSLTRNPWHVREYTLEEMTTLFNTHFDKVDCQGVAGNEVVMAYYHKNEAAVKKLKRFDPLDLENRLPRKLWQIPYDILNHRNRKKLMNQDPALVSTIKMEDYSVVPANEQCFDWFYIGHKA